METAEVIAGAGVSILTIFVMLVLFVACTAMFILLPFAVWRIRREMIEINQKMG